MAFVVVVVDISVFHGMISSIFHAKVAGGVSYIRITVISNI